jgi:hypothetical protein
MTMRDERGVAAVELALFMSLLVGFVALTGPLVIAFKDQLELGRAAGRTLRFATAVPDQRRFDCSGAPLGGRRPTAIQVVREARCQIDGIDAMVSPAPRGSLAGTEITVTLQKSVSLGIVGSFLGTPSLDLEATTTGVLE